jgi:hypothetical protein
MTTKKTYQKPLKIEMDFEEALERFGTTDPDELPANVKVSRKRREPRETQPLQQQSQKKNKPTS